MIKFIATDMDGTLLNSKKELSPEFYDVFEELKKRNILCSCKWKTILYFS